jgi:hypothetical protein
VLGQALAGRLSDPMSGFFMVRRTYLEKVVRRLYGRGFKVLLDLIAAARGSVRIHELPYHMRSRKHGESKLSARVGRRVLHAGAVPPVRTTRSCALLRVLRRRPGRRRRASRGALDGVHGARNEFRAQPVARDRGRDDEQLLHQ